MLASGWWLRGCGDLQLALVVVAAATNTAVLLGGFVPMLRE
jgi:hypothetical protein